MLKVSLQKIYKNKGFYLLTSFILHIFCLYCFYFLPCLQLASAKDQSQSINIDLDFTVGGAKRIAPVKTKKRPQTIPSKQNKQHVKSNVNNISKGNKAIKTNDGKLTNTKQIISQNKQNIDSGKELPSNKPEITESDIFGADSSGSNNATIIPNAEYIKAKIEQYRNFTYLIGGKSAKFIEIVVLIKLNIDGRVKSIINLYDNAGFFVNQNVRQALIYQNRRAIMLASPFDKLDPKDFEKWKEVKIRFTLKD
jgi:hypothetical protein